MTARMLPLEAAIMAFVRGISFERASTNAASEEKGRIVAAKKAETKRASSPIKIYKLLLIFSQVRATSRSLASADAHAIWGVM